MKIAIVVGHNSKAQGANSKAPLSISEFKYCNKIADKMVALATGPLRAKKFNRVKTTGYSREIDTVYALVDDYAPDISIELHFNSAGPSASGTETLSSGSTASLALANSVQASMLEALGLSNRGIKVKSRSERGGRSLHAGRAPAILIEPFFGSSTKDCKAADKIGIEGMAKMLLDGVKAYAGLEIIADPEETTTDTGAFLADVDLVHSNLTKKQFFTKNATGLKEIVAAINKKLEAEAHGEAINPLTMTDTIAIMNAEMGLKSNGKVNAHHVHSEGEKGLLPLPSNLGFWNGPQSANLKKLTLERNVKEFLLYLGNLKNKDIGRDFTGGALYRDLFTQKGIAGNDLKQMAILAAVVHGYFYAGNYNLGLPYGEISHKVIGAAKDHQQLIDFLAELGYKHASNKPEIIANRVQNLLDGIDMV